MISGGTISTLIRCLHEELVIETLQTRRDRNVILMFCKIINNNCPSYLTEMKPISTQQRQSYNLRRPNNYTLPKCRLSKYQKSMKASTLTSGSRSSILRVSRTTPRYDNEVVGPSTLSQATANPSLHTNCINGKTFEKWILPG